MPSSYEDQGGIVEFEVGEQSKMIELNIHENDAWNLEARQWVILDELISLGPVEVEYGELDRQSVVILNNDDFPGGLDPDALDESGFPLHSSVDIIWAFVMHIYSDAQDWASRWGTKPGAAPVEGTSNLEETLDPTKLRQSGSKLEETHDPSTVRQARAQPQSQAPQSENTGQVASSAHMGLALHIYPAFHWGVTQLMVLMALNVAFEFVNDEDEVSPINPNESEQKMKFRTVMYIMSAVYVGSLMIETFAQWELHEQRLGGKARMLLRRAIVGTVLRITEQQMQFHPTGPFDIETSRSSFLNSDLCL